MDNRTLDREIAERLFNLRIDGDSVIYQDESRGSLPYYSINPIANELVLNEIERRGWWYRFEYTNVVDLGPEYEFYLYKGGYRLGRAYNSENRYRPVCEAALQAVDGEAALQAAETERK